MLLFLVGCGSTEGLKDSVKPDNRKTGQIIANVFEHEFEPEYLSFRGGTTIRKGEMTNSFKATIRMKRDSVIWISVTAYGYEAFRLLAREDSLFLINRTEKTYFEGDFDFLTNQTGVELDFGLLQSILLGNSIGFEEAEKVKRTNAKDFYMLSSLNRHQIKRVMEKDKEVRKFDEVVYSHWVDPETYRIAQLAALDLSRNKTVRFEYSEFESFEGKLLATQIDGYFEGSEPIHMKSEYSRVSIEDELSFPFKIPSKYVEME